MGKHVKKRRPMPRRTILDVIKVISSILIMVVVLGAAGAYAYVKYIESKLHRNGKVARVISEPVGKEPINFLLLGSDTEGGEKARSDTIILVRLDPKKKSAFLLSIPRDLRVRIPGYGYDKINAALAYKGPSLLIETLEDYTGFDIHHYTVVNFKGFRKIVDALGGVEINVDKAIIDNSPMYRMYIPSGRQKFDGNMALNYVRYRHNDPEGDLGRIKRQQKFIRAVIRKSLRLRSTLKIPSLITIFANNAQTDLTFSEMLGLARFLRSMKNEDLETITLPATSDRIDGVSYMIPQKALIREILLRVKASYSVGELKGINAEEHEIKVLNGSGAAGVAIKAEEELESEGFQVSETGNAEAFDYQQTVVYYSKGSRVLAEVVSKVLGGAKVRPLESANGSLSRSEWSDIIVILGKSYEAPSSEE